MMHFGFRFLLLFNVIFALQIVARRDPFPKGYYGGKVASRAGLRPPFRETAMWVDNTVHYRTDPVGQSQYDSFLPASGSIVFVNSSLNSPSSRSVDRSEQSGPFTLALFHQIDCISILRSSYAARVWARKHSKISADEADSIGITPLTEHCINYLRQSVLCHTHTRLESVRYPAPPNVVSRGNDYRCYDWEKVYSGVKDGVIQMDLSPSSSPLFLG